MKKLRRFYHILGPGLIYAGAAIGVSHLVQSTRAGAEFGFDLLWILLLANILKYPFFEFGSRYLLATGDNLIKGYADSSRWALTVLLIFTVITMFPVQAAVTLVTAILANNLFGSGLSTTAMSACIFAAIIPLLVIGRFRTLDTTIKLVVIILTLSTVAAVVSALFGSRLAEHAITQSFSLSNKNHLYFLIALIGWMPTPIDCSLWSSLWSQAKNQEMSEKQTLQEALIDFRIGYAGSMLVAVAFLALGALIIHGSGESLAESGPGFASQLISMYTQSIGDWAYYFIAIAALTTMFSTTLTVTDAYPRVLLTIAGLSFPHLSSAMRRMAYLGFMLLVAGGALFLISIAGPRMTFMVDIATSLSFISAPILAYLNLRIMKSKRVPKSLQPGWLLSVWSWLGIFFLGFFTLAYIWWLMYN